MVLKDDIAALFEEALAKCIEEKMLPVADYPRVKVEYPRDNTFGDYSSPIAMESARVTRKNPMETGELIASFLRDMDLVEKVNVVKPGFINIFVSRDFLSKNIDRVRLEGAVYGRRVKPKPEKVNIEFVSANPTGPLNVVSARAAALGDTLANLLEAGGDTVDREYYINDFGNQVSLLGRSVSCRYREQNGESVVFPEDGYHGEYIKDVARVIGENHSEEIVRLRNDEEALSAFFSQKAVEYLVDTQKNDMALLKVKYACWFKESSLHQSGKVLETLDDLERHGVIFEEDGKKVFKSTDFGDDKDRVVLRDDGRPTYLLADIAYHRDKFSRGYDRVIDIWGPDHHGYIARIKGAIAALGYDSSKFSVLLSQQVNLLSGGELVKMSKRLGNFSSMRDLVEEIGSDVTRYFFVMRSMDSHLDFDLELAKKQSSENPVFYLQYAHARICSIFTEAQKVHLQPVEKVKNPGHFLTDEGITMLNLVAKYPDEVADAADNLEPHRITAYLLRLAQAYHKFYFEHRIITDDIDRSSHYLALCDAVRITIKNGLSLLGVSAPERM